MEEESCAVFSSSETSDDDHTPVFSSSDSSDNDWSSSDQANRDLKLVLSRPARACGLPELRTSVHKLLPEELWCHVDRYYSAISQYPPHTVPWTELVAQTKDKDTLIVEALSRRTYLPDMFEGDTGKTNQGYSFISDRARRERLQREWARDFGKWKAEKLAFYWSLPVVQERRRRRC